MDKYIIEKLIQFGLITNIGVNANDYKDVDDLIAKGIITVPGAKEKIIELIGNNNVEVKTPEILVVEDPAEVETVIVEEPVVESVEEPVVESVEETPKSKKSKKQN
jgi:hypothetical protein